ncbi:MAG TPA: type II toxin-antitoxin system prevent-host-death family antitoxin [Candidatus Dormibacteraeota bacterium]|nr:type II toxin-antitoxin system prevent-host-death family antitoxin [Candidatus Dormibacteraeota bacterium]
MEMVSSNVGVRELKARLGAYLAAVRSGREVVVTYRGRPVARLGPIDATRGAHAEPLVAAGRIIPPRSRHRGLPRERVELDGAAVSDLLRDQRR